MARARMLHLALCGLLVTVGLQVVTAAPAAAIPGLTNVTVLSPVNSNPSRVVIAPCPAGLRIIGGGAQLAAANSEVAITYLAPVFSTANAFEGRAYEDRDGFAANWQLIVTAICAPAPPGYQISMSNGPWGSSAGTTTTAPCSAGRQVIGAGGAVDLGQGVTVLTSVFPNAAATAVTAIGAETQGGFAGMWRVQAWAVCADPVPGHTVAVTMSVIDSLQPKLQISPCPAGDLVHGIGFELFGGVGEVFLNLAMPNPIGPVGTAVPVVASEDQTGTLAVWGIRTHAVCAT